MTSRLAKLRRIVSVQEKLHRLATYRLAELERQSAALRQDQESLVVALNDHEAFAGLFVDAMASQLKRLAREAERVDRAQAVETERVREAALKLKRTERYTGNVGKEHRRSAEKRGFQELLDLVARNRNASPV